MLFSYSRLTLFVSCHCSQLFGEEDADQEVSPDTADPEAECEWERGIAFTLKYLESYISLALLFTHLWQQVAAKFIWMVGDTGRNTLKCVCILWTGNPEETAARATASEKDGDIRRVSTKEWARSTGYDPVKLFNKVPDRQIRLVGLFQIQSQTQTS